MTVSWAASCRSKRGAEEMDVDEVQGDSPVTHAMSLSPEVHTDIVSVITACFGSESAFNSTTIEEKIKSLSILGSFDLPLPLLEQKILVPEIATFLFRAFESVDCEILAAEAALCLKNLMTGESSVSNRCTRRLYALGLFPVIERVMQRLLVLAKLSAMTPMLLSLVESVSIMVMCIASLMPVSLAQVNNSSFAVLCEAALTLLTDDLSIKPVSAILQAALVCAEDNPEFVMKLPEGLLMQQVNAGTDNAANDTLGLAYLRIALSATLIVCCQRSLNREIPSSLAGPLRKVLMMSTLSMTEVHYEAIELAAETLHQISIPKVADRKSLIQYAEDELLPALLKEWQHVSDAVEVNQRIKSVCSAIGNVFALMEDLWQSLPAGHCRSAPEAGKLDEMMTKYVGLALNIATQAREFNDCQSLLITDEVSGWLRAWLSMAWPAGSDYPEVTEAAFSVMSRLFFESSSPVVLTNACAIAALLIPSLSSAAQVESCRFLNNLLLTDPFDSDHLEILMAAVDAITGIFDPESKEWPVKAIGQLRDDFAQAQSRLMQSCDLDESLRAAVQDRILEIKQLLKAL